MLKIKRTLKIMKYDFGAMFKYWWIVALITPFAAFAMAIFYRGFFTFRDMFYNSTIAAESSVVSSVLLILEITSFIGGQISSVIFGATLIATEVIIFIRFFKNFYTDEGYLTFTLPVSRRELYFSKVVSSMVVTLSQIAIMGGGLIFMLFVAPHSDAGLWIFEREVWQDLFKMAAEWKAWLCLLLLIVNGVVGIVALAGSVFMEMTLIHMCITIGSVIVKRGKIFVATGFWFFLSRVFYRIVSNISAALFLPILCLLVFAIFLSLAYLLIGMISYVALIAAMTFSAGFLFYNVTQLLIDKKLNLA